MKLVISGSGGIGKTTLAQRIAKEIGATYIPEYLDIVIKEKGLNSFKEITEDIEVGVRMDAIKRKIEDHNNEENFVSDKGVIDYLAYWLIWTSRRTSEEDSEEFYSIVKDHLKSKEERTHLVLILGKYPFEDNSKRGVEYSHRLHVHSLIKGLYLEHKVNLIEYDYSFDKPINEVLKELEI